MKRLPFIVVVVLNLELPAQTFPVKNANDDYVITSLKGSEKYRNNIKEIIRDKSGLYWFQNYTEISSFDGVNWKQFQIKDDYARNVPLRINEIEVTDDSTVWLATTEGLYGFNRRSEKFIAMKELYPGLKALPTITNCIYKGINDFLLVSVISDGFYIFNWSTGILKYVIIDSVNKINVAIHKNDVDVVADRRGNYWGLTRQGKGIWFYNVATGEIKCSWKNEILPAAAQRLMSGRVTDIVYSKKDDALLLSYGMHGILEKIFLVTGKSVFYSFSGDLEVHSDTAIKDRLPVLRVKIDPLGNEWLLAGDKYLVKIDNDITRFEYLKYDPDLLPIGKMDWLLPEIDLQNPKKTSEVNLLWITGDKGLSILRKRNTLVRQILLDDRSAKGIVPSDFMNRDAVKTDVPFYNMFLAKGPGENSLLLQQNDGRPKVIKFDRNFRITGHLFGDQWRSFPAYFNPDIGAADFYIAILRPGEEPLDFRQVVVKDFRVDPVSMTAVEEPLDFASRVWRYGTADMDNVYWLFSNGWLYSYNPRERILDSVFVCKPGSKKKYQLSRIKAYDFPTVLHKKSSTFWISFISDRELYKINLSKKKVEKMFKGCIDEASCLPGSVYQLYPFGDERIYLKFNFGAGLINPFTDSLSIYSDLFKTKPPNEDYIGSVVYKDWFCCVTYSEINFQNTVTGRQKRLTLNQDYKWPISVISYAPLVNDRGEMVLLSSSQKGFVVFNLDSILYSATPGLVRIVQLKVNEKSLSLDSVFQLGFLKLHYNQYSSLHIKFSDYSMINQEKIRYEYALYKGGDTMWSQVEGSPDLSFIRIAPGNYQLLIRASNGFGDYSPNVTVLNLAIIPPFTQTIWFILLLLAVVAGILYGLYRYRMKQVQRLQAIRNNIASDLHDDIGSTLNSISIYSEVAKQQAGKDLPALELIGQHSRKIIESMSDIVWTINPENDSFEKIIARMRSFAHNMLKAKQVEYSFEVDEKLNGLQLPMQVRKNFYLIFKEAINNLVKYSNASTAIISLYEKNKTIVLSIYDNGVGIPKHFDYQGNGLLNMKRRAGEISAELFIHSGNGDGTSIELKLK